jgi:hypothetical protein
MYQAEQFEFEFVADLPKPQDNQEKNSTTAEKTTNIDE